jgi:alkaline phosphatase D
MRNIKRRTLVKGISSAGLLAASVRGYARPLSGDLAEVTKERIKGLPPDPFEGSIYGVASGDPSESAVTLWCRLPDAILNDVGNVGEIEWWIAETCGNTHQIVASGLSLATQDNDYTVHVRPAELRPDTNYFYGFRIGDLWQSDWGNARTLPAAMSAVERLRLAYFCCQLYGTGYYTAYQALCDTQVDFCVHLGDSVYESIGPLQKFFAVRPEPEGTAESLCDYRALHRRALGDPWYREARRRFTWICIPDDHEVANDYAGTVPATFLRQQSGIQAYLDYMPIQGAQIESDVGPIPVVPYRSYRCGQLATLYALNERQFRVQSSAVHANGEQPDPAPTILGASQMGWLLDQLSQSVGKPSEHRGSTLWNILLSETLMMPFRTINKPKHFATSALEHMLPLNPFQKPEEHLGTAGYPNTNDAWDGYSLDRQAIVDCLAAAGLRNTLVFTGDIHNMYAGQLLDSAGKPVAVEVTTGSISSPGIGDIFHFGAHKIVESLTAVSNPHMKAFNLKDHMVMICTLTPDGAEFESHCPATILQPASRHSIKNRLKVRRGLLEFL